jgi:queuine tRNA-ribosyltransferase
MTSIIMTCLLLLLVAGARPGQHTTSLVLGKGFVSGLILKSSTTRTITTTRRLLQQVSPYYSYHYRRWNENIGSTSFCPQQQQHRTTSSLSMVQQVVGMALSSSSNETIISTTNTSTKPLIVDEEIKTTIKPSSSSSILPPNQLEALPTTSEKKYSSSKKSKSPLPPPPPLPTPSDFPSWSYNDRDFFRFEIIHQSTKSQARVGRIYTPHGIIDTPGYVAVATNGALKGVDFRDATEAGQQLIFANTYHLMLHPGADLIGEAGGIHKFTNRLDRPYITDSGGFQVFSLAYGGVHEELASGGELKRASSGSKKNNWLQHDFGSDAVQVSEEGVTFRSYRDGSKFLLTPESTVQAQKKIGADIIIPLDELPPYHIDRQFLVESVDRSHRWEARSLQEHLKDVRQQAMYCVVHGGIDKELRTKSVNYLTSLPFDGYAIGGSLGNGKEELKGLLEWMMPLFDETPDRQSKPRHLLGIADEESIRNAVTKGIDTLDSCYPTRLARHGTILTREGTIKIKSGKHAKSFGMKLDEECNCQTCRHYDRSYLWHLFKANEPIATTLAAQHNIQYMTDLMAQLRQDIMEDKI